MNAAFTVYSIRNSCLRIVNEKKKKIGKTNEFHCEVREFKKHLVEMMYTQFANFAKDSFVATFPEIFIQDSVVY